MGRSVDIGRLARITRTVGRFGFGELLKRHPEVDEEVKATTKADLERGMAAIDRIFVGAPYATGETLTLADFYTFYTFGLASMVVQKIFDFDLLEGHDNIRALTEKLASHPSIARTEAEKAD